jgi:hypothetical protein
MRVTVVVNDARRELGRHARIGGAVWRPALELINDRQDGPLAPDERQLLDELTHLCRGILLEQGPVPTGD